MKKLISFLLVIIICLSFGYVQATVDGECVLEMDETGMTAYGYAFVRARNNGWATAQRDGYWCRADNYVQIKNLNTQDFKEIWIWDVGYGYAHVSSAGQIIRLYENNTYRAWACSVAEAGEEYFFESDTQYYYT